jgi:hypothetical protein
MQFSYRLDWGRANPSEDKVLEKTLDRYKSDPILQIQHESIMHGQYHHRDPTLILVLPSGTPTWSSMQGSYVG